MRWGSKKSMLALAVLLLSGFGAYHAGRHLWARRHHDAALQALERRDFRQAGLHLDKCLAVWSRDPSLRLLAAETARRRGDLFAARRHLRLYQELNGPEKERQRELQLHAVQQGDKTVTDRLLDACLRDPQASDTALVLEAVLEEKVKSLELAYNDGQSLIEGPAGLERVRIEQALTLWLQQSPGRSDQAQGLVWRGRAIYSIDPRQAAADFRRAVEQDPDHFHARLHLASSLGEFNCQEATDHLEILRRREPGHAQVSLLLASCRRSLGQFREAGLVLDELLAGEPEHAVALIERGKIALDAGRPAEAERFLRRALLLTPHEPGLHLALSRSLHLTGKEQEAKRHQERYSAIEAERIRVQRLREAQGRAARERGAQ